MIYDVIKSLVVLTEKLTFFDSCKGLLHPQVSFANSFSRNLLID